MSQAKPIIQSGDEGIKNSLSAIGKSMVIHEWSGSGPPYMHVHYQDDEAWHILEGELKFQFIDREVIASKGTTVFVPAGVAHTYFIHKSPSRYLMILTPQLNDLIAELHQSKFEKHSEVMKKYHSEIW
jgi:mannose-6-phosphate isomerase-like protein (cupin superfamily)